MVLIIKAETAHPYTPASVCSHTGVSGQNIPDCSRWHEDDMAGCHVAHGTLRKQLQSHFFIKDIQCHISLSFLKFLLYMLFLVLKSDVQSISLLSPHPWASAGLLEKGWVSVSKSQHSLRNLPFLPGQSICACRFIHKYRLNTLCVAAGPALWQISESIRHSSGFVVLIIVLER